MLHGWNQIADAPFDTKLTLQVKNEVGDVYLLPFSCIRTEKGFETQNGNCITVTPLQWRAYSEKRTSAYSRYMKTTPAPMYTLKMPSVS